MKYFIAKWARLFKFRGLKLKSMRGPHFEEQRVRGPHIDLKMCSRAAVEVLKYVSTTLEQNATINVLFLSLKNKFSLDYQEY